jgi:hypothetical protein
VRGASERGERGIVRRGRGRKGRARLLSCGLLIRRGGRSEDFCDAEIGDFHAPSFIEQQILGLDVAMHDPVLVRVLQRLTDGGHDGQSLLRRKAAGLHRLPEIHAIHKLHQEKVKAARLPEIVNRDDARMIERRECLSLTREPLRELGVRHPFGCQEL